ncbi:MAG TPA: prolipoprotein diacylglyceryl transferase [Marmoricola sp.]|nr:prolipoprotein diacylglyceryl transferase [Marmoricola sp.]
MAIAPMFIPSPSQGVWYLGPIPIRAYALCIIAGVIVAVWFGQKRWEARGGKPAEIGDIAIWAVPAGLVGARVYSLVTDPNRYFGNGHVWWEPLAVWHGGLGIWGGIAGGALGAWFYCRRHRVRLRTLADALAPALLLAQAIGRWGTYFNQELFGRPTTLPWGLEIAPANRPAGYEQYATFHPTFLYECVWDLGAAGLVLWLDRRLQLGWGRCFALYVMVYTFGRGWIEALRIDTVEFHFLGLRLNDWTSIVVFLGGLTYFVVVGRRHRGREESPYLDGDRADAPSQPASRPE